MRAERDIGFGPNRRGPKAASQQAPAKRGEREAKTLLRRRRLHRVRRTARIAALVLFTVGGLVAYRTGAVMDAIEALRGQFALAAADAGYVVQQVEVSGARRTQDAEIRTALDIHQGDPVFAFDMDAARARVEALGWVKTAVVARQLPDRVTVEIVEREPFAVWQMGGAFHLIDRDGAVITSENLGRFADLPLVVGEGAGTAAALLVETLAGEPALSAVVKSAVRVGGRRWDILFENGMRARLPEDGAARAWHRLSALVHKHDLLSRAVHVVDLRQEDRLVLRLTKEAAGQRRALQAAPGEGGAV